MSVGGNIKSGVSCGVHGVAVACRGGADDDTSADSLDCARRHGHDSALGWVDNLERLALEERMSADLNTPDHPYRARIEAIVDEYYCNNSQFWEVRRSAMKSALCALIRVPTVEEFEATLWQFVKIQPERKGIQALYALYLPTQPPVWCEHHTYHKGDAACPDWWEFHRPESNRVSCPWRHCPLCGAPRPPDAG